MAGMDNNTDAVAPADLPDGWWEDDDLWGARFVPLEGTEGTGVPGATPQELADLAWAEGVRIGRERDGAAAAVVRVGEPGFAQAWARWWAATNTCVSLDVVLEDPDLAHVRVGGLLHEMGFCVLVSITIEPPAGPICELCGHPSDERGLFGVGQGPGACAPCAAVRVAAKALTEALGTPGEKPAMVALLAAARRGSWEAHLERSDTAE